MKIWFRKASVAIVLAVVAAGCFTREQDVQGAFGCNYYASPYGRGNGLSQLYPFRIANFWRVASPGKTLCLIDGVYHDSINPPEHLNGTASARITIKAMNDGKVRINGDAVRNPVLMRNNDYFILEGFDAHNSGDRGSGGSVVRIGSGADHNIFRRICAWDAPADGNEGVWGFNSNTGNLLEDVCGFGTGRKIFSSSYKGTNLTIRRAWGRWEKSLYTGPKMTYSLVYASTGNIFENVIGTWDESSMGGTRVNQPYGIISMDSTAKNVCANAKYFGSIGYIRAQDRVRGLLGVVRSSDDTECLTFQDVVAYIEPGAHLHIKPFSLLNDPDTSTAKLVKNITSIGGRKSTIESQWQSIKRVETARMETAASIWNGAGARVCKRYVNGALTNEPLWPWPMNQRIIDAMKAAGKVPVDVTKTMEELFGAIPSECRSDSLPSSSLLPPVSGNPTP